MGMVHYPIIYIFAFNRHLIIIALIKNIIK